MPTTQCEARPTTHRASAEIPSHKMANARPQRKLSVVTAAARQRHYLRGAPDQALQRSRVAPRESMDGRIHALAEHLQSSKAIVHRHSEWQHGIPV